MKMKAWSYSAQDAFKTCPHRFYKEKILKLYPYETTEAQRWGTDVHEALEKRVRDKVQLEERFQHLEGAAKLVESLPGEHFFERHLACKREYYAGVDPETTPKENIWVHGYLDFMSIVPAKESKDPNDALDTALIVDWKSGKNRPTEQMHLYAAMIFSNFPKVRIVKTALIYLKTGEVVKNKFERGSDFFRLWEMFLPTIKRMELAFETNTWVKKPSGLCSYCPCRECDFWRERKQK